MRKICLKNGCSSNNNNNDIATKHNLFAFSFSFCVLKSLNVVPFAKCIAWRVLVRSFILRDDRISNGLHGNGWLLMLILSLKRNQKKRRSVDEEDRTATTAVVEVVVAAATQTKQHAPLTLLRIDACMTVHTVTFQLGDMCVIASHRAATVSMMNKNT